MKKYFKLIFINLGIIILFFLLAEGMVRLFAKDINLAGTSSDIFEENKFGSTLGFLPNVEGHSFGKKIITDEKGFINLSCTNYDTTKKSILFIGDSVTQGVETDSTFVGRLSCHFQEEYNIINASIIGYDLLDYKNVIATVLDKNELGVIQVVVNFCLNDISVKDSLNLEVNKKGISRKILDFLKSNSYLYIWLKSNTMDRSEAYFLHDSGMYKEAVKVEKIQEFANELNGICQEKGIRQSVVIFPYEFQIRENKKENNFPQEIIEAIFKTQNTPVFLPQSFLENKRGNHKSLYLFGDGIHFSTLGHQYVFDFFIHEKIIGQ